MKSLLLPSINLLFIFLFASSQMFAQEERYHSIVVQTQKFDTEDLNALKQHLKQHHNFLVPGACRETGLVLVEYSSSISLRIGTAETMVIEAIEEVWRHGATVVKDLPREEVLSCIED